MPEPVRLQKLMSQRGLASRRDAEKLIEAGLVSVNGETAVLGMKVMEDADIQVDQASDDVIKSWGILLNKPVDVVTTKGQAEGKNVFELLPDEAQQLAYAGRLDKDSRGLVLLLSDGTLSYRLTAPETHLEKEYVVKVDARLLPMQTEKLKSGIKLGDVVLKPARVFNIKGDVFHITLTEGRKRQIRRMCKKVGLEVLDLQRIRLGTLKLGDLPEGEWRELEEEEIEALKNAIL